MVPQKSYLLQIPAGCVAAAGIRGYGNRGVGGRRPSVQGLL